MQNTEFDQLLVDIKCFLAKNAHVEGAFNLLARLDCYLETKFNNQNNGDGEQIILDSEDQQISTVQPRKFASMLDIFILEYNFSSQAYQVVPLSPTTKSQQLEGNRTAICQLILSPLKQHLTQKQKTNSMTQLHKLTANVPKTQPPLILPNYSQQPFKYIYIYQSKQCMEWNTKYYLTDRYYCFVVDGLAGDSVDLLYKDIRNRVFQERIMRSQDSVQVNCKFVAECMVATLPLLVDRVNQFNICLGQPAPVTWVEDEKQFYFQQIKTIVVSSLLLIITYFAMCQFKIIFVCSKDQKHKLSDIVISKQGALYPLKYVYPVVFCTLSGNHCDFVQSPVPLTIGFWGNERRRTKFEQQLKYYLSNELKGIPTILIDLSKNIVKYSTGVTNEDVFVIEKLNRFVQKYSKGSCMYKKISSFMSQLVIDIKNNKKEKSQWLTLLHKKVKNSQMYHHCDKN